MIYVAFLLIKLAKDINSTDVELYIFEAYVFYFGVLLLLCFPLGSLFIVIFMLVGGSFFNNVNNDVAIIIITILGGLGFYLQWYNIYPKLKVRISKMFCD